jgi:hypothetical protein
MICAKGKGQCLSPCRKCMVPRDRLMDPNIDDIKFRESSETFLELLDDAWIAFCRDIRRDVLTDRKLPLSRRATKY